MSHVTRVKMFYRSMSVATIIWELIFLQWTMSTEIIPERAQVDYADERYLTNATAFIKRYARRSPYYINVQGTVMQALGDDISLHGVFYEFLHNEYKRSCVELFLSLCDLFNKSPWKELVGAALLARGAICPLPPGTYILHNFTISMDQFPYVWPFEKVLFKAYAKHKPSQDVVLRAMFYLTFETKLPKKI